MVENVEIAKVPKMSDIKIVDSKFPKTVEAQYTHTLTCFVSGDELQAHIKINYDTAETMTFELQSLGKFISSFTVETVESLADEIYIELMKYRGITKNLQVTVVGYTDNHGDYKVVVGGKKDE